MRIQSYSQTTFETCLAVDLLQLTQKNITKKEELNVINYAMEYSKDNFTIGHLDYISKKYGLNLAFYVDNPWFFKFISKFKFSKNINIICKNIDLNFVDNQIKTSPVIVYVDAFALWKITHAPHFIIVISKTKSGYKIYDPWDGKIRTISRKVLAIGIVGLRDYLKYCPQLIQKI